MLSSILHANTKAMLLAWKRMIKNGNLEYSGPSADDYPGLLGGLFVIEQARADVIPFRIAGETLTEFLGHDLVGTNFIDLWTGADRQLVSALLSSIVEDQRPGVMRLRGTTRQDRRLDIEISLAPLERRPNGGHRFLGLYQTLGGEAMLKNQPIISHKIKSLFPPQEDSKPVRKTPHLKLVSKSPGT